MKKALLTLTLFVILIAKSVAQLLPLNVTISATQPSCGLSNGSVTASAGGGAGSYTYLWNNGATTPILNNLSPGTYTLTVTDANGTSATGSKVLNSSTCPKVNSLSFGFTTSTSVVVNWPGLDCATKYRLLLKKNGSSTQITKIVNAPTSSYTFTNLEPNTTYQVRIRTQCSQNGSVLSQQLSPIFSFTTLTTQGIQCLAPLFIESSIIASDSAILIWAPAANVIQYNIRYRVTGTTPWSNVFVNDGNAESVVLNNLTPATGYDVQIRSKCNNNPEEFSAYSGTYSFSTAPLRMAEGFSTPNVSLYPNPADQVVYIALHSVKDQNIIINIADILGRTVRTETKTVNKGAHSIPCYIADLKAGIYMVQITAGNKQQTLKLIIE